MISYVRVDNRLIHGQVVEAWLPHWKVRRLLVADDETADNALMKSAMGLAVPEEIEVQILGMSKINFSALAADNVSTLVLVRDVDGLLAAQQHGLPLRQVNVGNVHFAQGRKQVTPSVFLSAHETRLLKALETSGVQIELRAVPSDKPVTPSQIQD